MYVFKKKNGKVEIEHTGKANKNFEGKVEKDKMIISVKQQVNVKDIDEEYILGKMINKVPFDIKDEDIRYSFDATNRNFHIVPKYTKNPKTDAQNEKNANAYHDAVYYEPGIRPTLKKRLKEQYDLDTHGTGRGKFAKVDKPSPTQCHIWLEIIWNEFKYLISFQSLYCDDNVISCELGRIQFSAFDTCYDGPNFNKAEKFKMMYPTSSGTETYDEETHHRVCNTNYYVPFDENDLIIDAIIRDFILFINQTEDLRSFHKKITKRSKPYNA